MTNKKAIKVLENICWVLTGKGCVCNLCKDRQAAIDKAIKALKGWSEIEKGIVNQALKVLPKPEDYTNFRGIVSQALFDTKSALKKLVKE